MTGCVRPILDRATKKPLPNRWELRFELPRVNGERKTGTKAFTGTKRQAEVELRKILTAADKGESVAPSKGSVGEHLKHWLCAVKPTVTPKTYERYEQICEDHLQPYFGATRLDRLTANDVRRYIEHALANGRKKGGALSPQSVSHYARVLHQALELAVDDGKIARNPAKVTRPRVEPKEPEALSIAEVDRLLTAAEGKPIQPLVTLAVLTGMRRGELLAVRWRDTDLENGTLIVQRSLEETDGGTLRFKGPKTSAGRRVIQLPPEAIAALQRHKGQQSALRLRRPNWQDNGLIFCKSDGRPLSPGRVSHNFRYFTRRAGFDVSLHEMRHTFASLTLHLGANMKTVQRMLGHANINVTIGRYGHLLGGEQEAVASLLQASLSSARDSRHKVSG